MTKKAILTALATGVAFFVIGAVITGFYDGDWLREGLLIGAAGLLGSLVGELARSRKVGESPTSE